MDRYGRYGRYPQEETSEFRSILPIENYFEMKEKSKMMMERLKILAQPKVRPQIMENSKSELLSVSSFIIYDNSPRLLQLAQPKRMFMLPPKETGISQRALRAEASARIIELAKPKHSVDLDQLKRIKDPQRYYSNSKRKNRRLKAQSHSWVSSPGDGLVNPRRFRRTLSQRSVIDLGNTLDNQPKKPRVFR